MKKLKKYWAGSHRGSRWKQWVALTLAFAILMPSGGQIFAYREAPPPDTLCVHHPEHTAECGYAEAAEESPCTHVHDEACGYLEPVGPEEPKDPENPEDPAGSEDSKDPENPEGPAGPEDFKDPENPEGPAGTEESKDPENPEDPAGTEESKDPEDSEDPAISEEPVPLSPDAPVCGHTHDEDCGYQEAREASPCGYVCALCVTGWQWDDPEGLLVWNQDAKLWGLTVPGTDEGHPLTREALADMLPQTVSAETAAGAQTVPLAWEFGQFPERDAYLGVYTLTAALEGDFVLTSAAPALEATLILGDGETYAVYSALALNDWTWAGFGKQGTDVVISLGIDKVTNADQLVTALKQVLPKRIYGSSMGNSKVTDDGPYKYDRYDATATPPRTWGYLEVNWDNLSEQIHTGMENGTIQLDLGTEFVVKAGKPVWEGTTYYINNIWDGQETETMPITIQLISHEDHIVTAASPENVTVNLFDYCVDPDRNGADGNNDLLDKTDWHLNPAKESVKRTGIDDWNKGINKNRFLLFGDGLIHAGLWNKGAGAGTDYGKAHAGMAGIVKNTLGENGYPVINTDMYDKCIDGYQSITDWELAGDQLDSGDPGNEFAGALRDSKNQQNISNTVYNNWRDSNNSDSLDYLFNLNADQPYKRAFENVKGLFQIDDEGYYFYNMRENFAEFQQGRTTDINGMPSDGKFVLYDAPAVDRTDNSYSNGGFTGGRSVGNFFPFNTASQVFDGLENGKLSSSENIQSSNHKSEAGRYMNHHLGMTVEVDFRQPANGMVNTGVGSKPMTFAFSGDDDVWVFIDDVLVLDLGGTHSEIYGVIDFSTGEIAVGQSWKTNGFPKNSDGTVDIERMLTDEQILTERSTLKEKFALTENAQPVQWAEGKDTFASNTSHTLKMFYLERGNYDSSLALRFNLQPLLHQRIIKVDQYGKPIEGVTFDLYGAEDLGIDKGNNDGAIQCLYTDTNTYNKQPFYVKQTDEHLVDLTTDKDGSAVFKDKDDNYFNFADRGDQYYVLRETSTPDGYRSQPEPLVLHYDTQTAALSVANRWTTGAYACSLSNIAAGGKLKYGELDGGTITTGSETVPTADQKDGMVVAVPLLKKSEDTWLALYGSNLQGFDSTGEFTNKSGEADWKTNILTAALNQAKGEDNAPWHLDWDEENQRLHGKIFDLPGLGTRYKLNNPDGDMHMVYGIISSSFLNNLDIKGATPEARYTALRAYLQEHGVESTVGSLMDGFRFLNPGQFNRDFRSMIYIPNERRSCGSRRSTRTERPLKERSSGCTAIRIAPTEPPLVLPMVTVC